MTLPNALSALARSIGHKLSAFVDLGCIDFWLEIYPPPSLRGLMSLLAKFARSDPPGPLKPSLLGLEFFLTHQTELTLLLPPQHSVIRLP